MRKRGEAVKCQFTETSFMVNHTCNCERWFGDMGITVSPDAPNTVQEYDLAYDIELELSNGDFCHSLFLQHKVPEYLTRGSRCDNYVCRTYGREYYRFKIRKNSANRQHNVMCALAKSGEDIYYCAPTFHLFSIFKDYIKTEKIVDNSRLFDPLEMGPIVGNDQHYVSYSVNGEKAHFHSLTKELHNPISSGELIREWKSKGKDEVDLKKGYLTNLENKILVTLKEMNIVSRTEGLEEQKMISTRIAKILKVDFNIDWIVVRNPNIATAFEDEGNN